MGALAAAHDTTVQMIDTSAVRVHQHGACFARNREQHMVGRSRGGLTSKVHAVVDRARNLVERFFNKIKQCRHIATRHDKVAASYLARVKLASIRLWLRAYESAPSPL
jgi:transposase